jgi:hypothetical protein
MSTQYNGYPAPDNSSYFTPSVNNRDRLAARADSLAFVSRVPRRETLTGQRQDVLRMRILFNEHRRILSTLINRVVICHVAHTQLNMHANGDGLSVRVLTNLRRQDAVYDYSVDEDGTMRFGALQHAYLNKDKQHTLHDGEVQLWRATAVLQLVADAAHEIGHPGYEEPVSVSPRS